MWSHVEQFDDLPTTLRYEISHPLSIEKTAERKVVRPTAGTDERRRRSRSSVLEEPRARKDGPALSLWRLGSGTHAPVRNARVGDCTLAAVSWGRRKPSCVPSVSGRLCRSNRCAGRGCVWSRLPRAPGRRGPCRLCLKGPVVRAWSREPAPRTCAVRGSAGSQVARAHRARCSNVRSSRRVPGDLGARWRLRH